MYWKCRLVHDDLIVIKCGENLIKWKKQLNTYDVRLFWYW